MTGLELGMRVYEVNSLSWSRHFLWTGKNGWQNGNDRMSQYICARAHTPYIDIQDHGNHGCESVYDVVVLAFLVVKSLTLACSDMLNIKAIGEQ